MKFKIRLALSLAFVLILIGTLIFVLAKRVIAPVPNAGPIVLFYGG